MADGAMISWVARHAREPVGVLLADQEEGRRVAQAQHVHGLVVLRHMKVVGREVACAWVIMRQLLREAGPSSLRKAGRV
jgi:hypothetical protein